MKGNEKKRGGETKVTLLFFYGLCTCCGTSWVGAGRERGGRLLCVPCCLSSRHICSINDNNTVAIEEKRNDDEICLTLFLLTYFGVSIQSCLPHHLPLSYHVH